MNNKKTEVNRKRHNYSQINNSTWQQSHDPSHNSILNDSAKYQLHNHSEKCQFNNITIPNREKVILAGLFDIHGTGLEASGKECSDHINHDAVQNLEAMLYAIKQVNLDESILHGIQIDVTTLDTCRNPERTKRQTVEFIEKGMSAESGTRDKDIVGIVGASDSDVSKKVTSNFQMCISILQMRGCHFETLLK